MKATKRICFIKLSICLIAIFWLNQTLLSSEYNPQEKEQILKYCPPEVISVIGINLKKLKQTPSNENKEALLNIFFRPYDSKSKSTKPCLQILKLADYAVIYQSPSDEKMIAFQSTAYFKQWENIWYLTDRWNTMDQFIKLTEKGNGEFVINEVTKISDDYVKVKETSDLIIVGKLSNSLPNNLVIYGFGDGLKINEWLGTTDGEMTEKTKKFNRDLLLSEEFATHKLVDLLKKINLKKDFWWVNREELKTKKDFIASVGQLDFDSSEGSIEIYCKKKSDLKKLQKKVFTTRQSTGISIPLEQYFSSNIKKDHIELNLKEKCTAFHFLGLKYKKTKPALIIKPVKNQESKKSLLRFQKMFVMFRTEKDRNPKNIKEILDYGVLQLTDFISPLNKNDKPHIIETMPKDDFTYLPIDIGAPNHLILFYENPKFHNNKGTNVLFKDTTMGWLDIEEFNSLLKESQKFISGD